ncbi:SOS response-associated peptidase [Paenibacillus filicis]|uniref:Abasic site processing protein n=1 Tax=Paenibacillus gyeongsangnamensis TaxID=3388067 RepID=A0ABT4Q859_9BACL|nr:SOS response-associated peptidase [Paenibacillus filicis]MCZ8512890.1 SOS response-associated peptidase [Paenibacillus filicis]
MCGRFTITVSWDELVMRFLLDGRPGKYQPRYNIAPGQWIPAIIGGPGGSQAEERRFGELRWGLVPAWSKDESGAYRLINLRSETAADRPSFRRLLERKRCIVPADGFYEWKPAGRSKQPMRFTRKDGELFGMASLYDTWVADDGMKLSTCTILTVDANALVSEVHQRMPVILTREAERTWLDRSENHPKVLGDLLRVYPPEEMRYYPVDPRVGKVQNDDPGCIEPAADPA